MKTNLLNELTENGRAQFDRLQHAVIFQTTPTNEYVSGQWCTSVPVSLETARRLGITCVRFSLPGRGGPVTQRVADHVHDLVLEGKTMQEVSTITGCEHRA